MEFLILLRSWLRLKIGNIRQLAKIRGFCLCRGGVMIDQFIDLLRAWLSLGIGTVEQLAEVSGYKPKTIRKWLIGCKKMSGFVADTLLTSMGVIEQKLMGCGK